MIMSLYGSALKIHCTHVYSIPKNCANMSANLMVKQLCYKEDTRKGMPSN